jgi:hypothetical protein
MFVGYSPNTQDTYRFYNKTTNCVIVSRDAIWLNKMYFKPQRHRVQLDHEVDDYAVDPGDQFA